MTSKHLTEAGWKAAARDAKLKDKDLRRALADLQAAGDDDHEGRLRAVTRVSACARALRKEKEVAAERELAAYLDKLLAAAREEESSLEKQKLAAGRAAAARADDDAEDEEDEDDDGRVPYPEELAKALEKLKGATKPWHAVVCLARPHCYLALGKTRPGGRRLKRLSEVSGSKRFLRDGSVRREGVELVFEFPKDVPGLARLLQRSIVHFTRKKLRVTIGSESAGEEDEGGPPGAEERDAGRPDLEVAGSDAPAGRRAGDSHEPRPGAALAKAPQLWTATRGAVHARVEQLKGAVRKAFAGEGADTVAELEQGLRALDRVFESLDDDLSELLEQAAAADGRERQAALARARALLTRHVQLVKTDPIIAHIDANPFGVATDLQGTLTKSLKHVIGAIGDGRAG